MHMTIEEEYSWAEWETPCYMDTETAESPCVDCIELLDRKRDEIRNRRNNAEATTVHTMP